MSCGRSLKAGGLTSCSTSTTASSASNGSPASSVGRDRRSDPDVPAHAPRLRPDDVRASEIDAIAVYCLESGGCYLLPIEDVRGRWEIRLRTHAGKKQPRV